MKILCLLLLSITTPSLLGASVSTVPNKQFHSRSATPGNLNRFETIAVSVARRAENMIGSQTWNAGTVLSKSKNGRDGTWLAFSGLLLGLLVIISWFISPYLGIFTTLPLGLAGLLFSLIALKKANRRWYRTKAIRVLSIFGIVLNSLLALLFLALLALSS